MNRIRRQIFPLIFVEDPELALQEMARAYREELRLHRLSALLDQMENIDERSCCKCFVSLFQCPENRRELQ